RWEEDVPQDGSSIPGITKRHRGRASIHLLTSLLIGTSPVPKTRREDFSTLERSTNQPHFKPRRYSWHVNGVSYEPGRANIQRNRHRVAPGGQGARLERSQGLSTRANAEMHGDHPLSRRGERRGGGCVDPRYFHGRLGAGALQ